MGKMGAGLMTPLGGAKVITFNDKAGNDKLILKDSDGFVVASIDSQGNLRMRGKVMRV